MTEHDNDAHQCTQTIEEKSGGKLSEDAKKYACGILRKADVEASQLDQNQAEKLARRAREWEKGLYGDFIETGAAQQVE